MIQDQVKLPLRVAFGVVLQGIRIRFGRSLITIGGVVLGIAFLMANLTGQSIKEAVRGEDAKRAETKRMASFLAAEMGPPQGRVIGVIQTGPLNEDEKRLFSYLAQAGVKRMQWCAISADIPELDADASVLQPVALDAVAEHADGVLLAGEGSPPAMLSDAAQMSRLFQDAQGKVLAITRGVMAAPADSGVSVAALAREWTPEELAKQAKEQRDVRFRSLWITAISLVVTVAGIANAMLMSVTERFREIGTMKCLGALSSFIRWVFLVESALLGAAGGVAGACFGALFAYVVYGYTYGYGMALQSSSFTLLAVYFISSVFAGIVLSIIAAIYPASVAAAMAPAHALATNV